MTRLVLKLKHAVFSIPIKEHSKLNYDVWGQSFVLIFINVLSITQSLNINKSSKGK